MRDYSTDVQNAIKSGKLIKPDVCSFHSEDCSGRIEAHHWSRKKEHKLDVIWMCKKHHEEAHAQHKVTTTTHHKGTPVYFFSDEQTDEAISLITRVLGRGNKSAAIRRAIIDAAERIQLQAAMENIDKGIRLDQSLPRKVTP